MVIKAHPMLVGQKIECEVCDMQSCYNHQIHSGLLN
jgi:hypothetical protein